MEAALLASFTTSPSCSSSQSATCCPPPLLCTSRIPLPQLVSFSLSLTLSSPPHAPSLPSSISPRRSIALFSIVSAVQLPVNLYCLPSLHCSHLAVILNVTLVVLPLGHLTQPLLFHAQATTAHVNPSLSMLHRHMCCKQRCWPAASAYRLLHLSQDTSRASDTQ